MVLTNQFPGDGPIETLYRWEPVTDFVREVLGFETLYRTACPHLSLGIGVEGEGDQLGWHFDTNDGVVSLLLQEPDEGGHFEYAPYIRAEDDEDYVETARLFAGEPGIAQRALMKPGTFVLFNGRRSCHRVTLVEATSKPRLIALLSYGKRPGMVFTEANVRDAMNPSSETYYGLRVDGGFHEHDLIETMRRPVAGQRTPMRCGRQLGTCSCRCRYLLPGRERV